MAYSILSISASTLTTTAFSTSSTSRTPLLSTISCPRKPILIPYFHSSLTPTSQQNHCSTTTHVSRCLFEEQERSKLDRFILIRKLLFCALVPCVGCLVCGSAIAAAAADTIRASGIGLKMAAALGGSGWPNEAIVFALAMLPVIELRGAIPVGYWMQLHPLHLTVLSVLGNMVPVPIIILYLKKFASFLSQNKNASATSTFLNLLIERAREKAGPVEEFRWLGLMLFVAVPFPGTGAWTGAFIAAVLDMPFWSAVSANFFGVVLAGLLVNLLVNLGIKYAFAVGLLLFFLSTVMWGGLRQIKKSMNSNSN